MGTHPIFESDFDCLTETIDSMSARTVLGYITCPNTNVAKELASKAISAKLAACGNIIPGMTSVYEWKGNVETETEVSLILKTQQSLQTELSEFIVKNHPYEVPCVVFLPVTGGHTPFMNWVVDQTTKKGD